MAVSSGGPGSVGSTGDAPRVSIKTLGCKVNQVESEQILAAVLASGFESSDELQADVVVVNTCSVTGEADAKARKAIRHALHANPEACVIVTGCLATLEPVAVAELGERVVVVRDPSQVAGAIAQRAGASPPGNAGALATRTRSGVGFHTRAMVKIEDGCDSFCSYCVVPYARGNPRSVAADEVLAECGALADAGVKEIVLTGINLGRYRDAGIGLAELIGLVASTGVPRLRLSSIEPQDLTDDLLQAAAGIPAFCEHLHVPLQSGDDGVLREMGRRYTTAEYAELIASARRAIPGLAVSTDVLAGFPGESDAQAERTLGFCRDLGFNRLHVFRYSPRQRTPAAQRVDQVPPTVRAERAAALRELDRELRASEAVAARGRERELLVERARMDGPSGTPVAEGTTREYERARLSTSQAPSEVTVGSLVTVVLGAPLDDGVLAASLVKGTNPRVLR